MSQKYHEIMLFIGAPKASTTARQGTQPSTLTMKERIAADSRMLCRAVMRHPDQEIIHQLEHARLAAKEKFSGMNDDEIKWLLGGSAHGSRGGFEVGQDGNVTDNGVRQFRTFINARPDTLRPQALLTKIETLCTAIAYRGIKAQLEGIPKPQKGFATAEDRQKPDFDVSEYLDGHSYLHAVYKIVEEMMNDKKVPFINNVYMERAANNILTDATNIPKNPAERLLPSDVTVAANQMDVSDASDVEESVRQPHARGNKRLFHKVKSGGELTWLGAADAANIPIRHNISGTAASTLAALDSLCASLPGPGQNWLDDDDNLHKMSGALVIATYDRGDFHTIAETGAGAIFFKEARKHQKEKGTAPRVLTAREAFEAGLDMMKEAISDTLAPNAAEDETMTMRHAFQLESANLLARVTQRAMRETIFARDQSASESIAYKPK